MVLIIIFLILFAPLAFGAVYPWAYGLMEAAAFSLIGLWCLKGIMGKTPGLQGKGGQKAPLTSWAWIWLFGWVFFALIQVAPFPSRIIKSVSPAAYQIYLPVLGNQFMMLSLDRFGAWTELLKLFAYLSIFLILVYYPFEDYRKVVRRICLAGMGVGVVVGLLGLVQRFAGAERILWIWKPFVKKDKSFYGPFVNPNHFAVYMEMICGLFLGYLAYRLVKEGCERKSKGIKAWIVEVERVHMKSVLLFFLLLIMTVSLFFSLSRGGIVIILNAFLFFLVMIFLRRRRAKGTAVLAIIFGLALVLYLSYLGLGPILKELQTLFRVVEDISAQSRILVWKDVWSMIKAFPLVGVGLGGFGAVFSRFMTLQGRLGRGTWLYAHNDYLQIWAELGVGGLILVCSGFMFFFAGVIRWVRRKESAQKSREARRYLELGCYMAIFCFLVHSVIGYSFYVPANMMLFAVICGMLVRMQRKRMRYHEPINTQKQAISRPFWGVLLIVALALISVAIWGGYGESEHQPIIDREFREKVLDEISVARIMPLWGNSPYEHYFLSRWFEAKGFTEGIQPEGRREWFEKAVRETVKAIEFQPARSLFWERLGYLIGNRSSLSPGYYFSFPKSEKAVGFRDAFERALYFSPHDALLHDRIGSYLWAMGDSSGLGILQKAIHLDPALRKRIERQIKPHGIK